MERFFAILADGVAPLRGHGQPVHRRRHHGAVRRADRARGPRAARLLRGAPPARRAARATRDELRREHGLSFSVRMGLNSGEVVVGKIGDDLRMDYTAQGHTVGLAQRMEQLAEPGQALPHRAHGGARRRATSRSRPRRVRRSRASSRAGARLRARRRRRRCARASTSRARAASRASSAATTRWRALEAALARSAATGNGQVVGVVGEAGRRQEPPLLRVRSSAAGRAGIPVYEAHGVAHGKAIPLLPVLELLRAYFGITEQDGDAGRAREDRRHAAAARRELRATTLPLLFDFLGVPDPERPAAAHGPRGAPAPAPRAAAPALVAGARARASRRVILFEDLHWIDAASEAFLASMVEAVGRHARRCCCVNFRPEYRARVDAASRTTSSSPLAPLGAEAIARAARRPARHRSVARRRSPTRSASAPAATRSSSRRSCSRWSRRGSLAGRARRLPAGRAGRRRSTCRRPCRRCSRRASTGCAEREKRRAADGGGDRQGVRRAGARGASPSSRDGELRGGARDARATPSSSTSRRSTRRPSTPSSTR